MSAQARSAIWVVMQEKAWRAAGADLPARINRAARLALARTKAPSASTLTILLTDNAHVHSLNRRHRGIDKATNVLSFPAVQPDYLGDIAIAYGVAAREAENSGKPLANHAIHLAVHGVLHLLGYDHERPREAESMEALETALLAEMGIPDPYRMPNKAGVGL